MKQHTPRHDASNMEMMISAKVNAEDSSGLEDLSREVVVDVVVGVTSIGVFVDV